MVDLKFYVSSIVAVFLALALGILLGSVIVGQQDAPISQKLIKSIEADIERVRTENQLLSKENQEMRKFLGEVYPYLIKDRLFGQKIGLVYFGSEMEGVAREVKDFLEEAAAKVGLVEFDIRAFEGSDPTVTAQSLGFQLATETTFPAVISVLSSKLTTVTVDLPPTLGKLGFVEIKDFGLNDLPFSYLVIFLPSNRGRVSQLAEAGLDEKKTIFAVSRSTAESLASVLSKVSFKPTVVSGVDTLPGKVSLVFAFGRDGADLGYGKSHYFPGGKLK